MHFFSPSGSLFRNSNEIHCCSLHQLTRSRHCIFLIKMSRIEIYDTEVFTGILTGPLVFGYELEFFSQEKFYKDLSIKRPLTLSNSSRFVVPLPPAIDSADTTIVLYLNELITGRNIFTTEVLLGDVFYHDFGTIPIPAQLLLADHPHSTLREDAAVLSTRQALIIALIVVVVGAYRILKICWRTARRTLKTKSKPSNKPHRHSQPPAPFNTPPARTTSLSSLTDTDKESGSSRNSLQPPPVPYSPSQPAPLQRNHTTRRLKRRHKANGVVNSFEDRNGLGSGCWDPFASSSW